MTISRPRAAATGQPVPNGPRTPDDARRPPAARCALLTAPTSRTVCTNCGAVGRVAADADRHLADAEGVEHVELAGLKARRARRTAARAPGSRCRRAPRGRLRDAVERRHERIRRSTATALHAPGSRRRRDLQPRRVQAPHQDRQEALHHFIAEMVDRPRTCRAGSAASMPMRARQLQRPRVEHPAIGRHQPGRADDLAARRRLRTRSALAPAHAISSATLAVAHEKELVGRLAFAEQIFARLEAVIARAAGDELRAVLCGKPARTDAPAGSAQVLPCALLRCRGRRRDGGRLLGDVDADRAPGDAAPAADAARRAELVDPVGQLVGHPLPVARARRAAARCRREDRRNPG